MNNMKDNSNAIFFTLKVVTPEKVEFFSEKVKYLKVRTVRGDVGILPKHTNFMSSLGEGLMLIRTENEEFQYFVSGGFLDVSNNIVNVLAEEAMISKDEEEFRRIKKERIEKAIEAKRKEDQDIMGVKKRLQDSLMK